MWQLSNRAHCRGLMYDSVRAGKIHVEVRTEDVEKKPGLHKQVQQV